MVIAFQSVVVLSVLFGVAYLVHLTRAYDLTPGPVGPRLAHVRRSTAPGAITEERLRLGLAVPSNGQACGPS